jgi:large repetitive protein
MSDPFVADPIFAISKNLRNRLRESETRATTAVQLNAAIPYPELQTTTGAPATTLLRYPQEVMTDGPAGYWRMEEAEGATIAVDSSGNGHDGEYLAGTELRLPGALNVAQASDENFSVGRPTGFDHLWTADPFAATAATTAVTCECWVYIESYGAGSDVGMWGIFRGGVANETHNYLLWVWGAAFPSLQGQAQLFGSDGSTRPALTELTPILSLNEWHHLVATYSSTGGGDIYLDGVAATHKAPIGALNASGVTTTSVSAWAGARVDEVAVYLDVLSADDVLRHYNAGRGVEVAT